MLLVLPFSKVVAQSSQVFISELWTGSGGQTAVFYHNVSKTDDLGNVYIAGSTINTSGNHDIIVQKFDKFGYLLWQQTYNGAADMDDMAADLFIDDQYNVYVTGAITVNAQNSFDLGVLKFNSSGISQWQYVYNGGGAPVPYDAGTAITGDNNGSVYVTGGSFGTTTMADYVTARIDASNGNEIWLSSYDHDELNDLSAKIAVKLGQVVVSGASQITTSPEAYELATITYAASNGNFVSERRTSGSATDGVDEVYDLVVDDDGFIYIAGAVKNTGSDFDIKLYKLNDDLNIVWEVDFDGYQAKDVAHGVAVNDEGEIYLTGYVTHPSQGRNIVTLKYDAAGTLLWNREYHGEMYGDDEGIQLVIDDEGRVFVAGEIRNGEYSDYVTIGYYSDGSPFGQAVFDGPQGLDDRPTGMAIDLDGNIIVTGLSEEPGGELRNRTVKYSVYDKPIDPVIIDSVPSHNANELLIRFDRSVMNYAAVDNKNFTAGQLSDFVKPQVIDSMNAKVPGVDFEKLEAFKVFQRMTTKDSLSITRLGDTLRLGDSWATLSVLLPATQNLNQLSDSIGQLYPLIRFSCLNHVYATHSSIPNDELMGTDEQASLVPTVNFPNAHINIAPAWEISTGYWSYWAPKVGVFDTPIYWAHEDFGDGTFVNSKIKGGFDVYTGTPVSNISAPHNSHGTAVAGIIGALRNNNEIGIAGIAGGDVDEEGKSGADLYSFGIFHPDLISGSNQAGFAGVANVSSAIHEGAVLTPDGNYGYGLEIQNHSWGGPEFNPLMAEAIEVAWRNDCVLVAGRGNNGTDQLQYPACFDDDHILNVIASGSDGNWKEQLVNGVEDWSSAYGGGADFMAPGSADVVSSTIFSGEPHTFPVLSNCTSLLFPDYQCFAGTSASAPHVSGVSALMMAAHNVYKGAPNNLAPEDIEKILEKTASSSGAYSNQEGWGLINAGAAVNEVNYPSKYVIRPLITNIQESVTTDITFILANNAHGIAAGTYVADRHNFQITREITLPENHEIIDWWQLKGKTFPGLSAAVPNSGEPWMIVNTSVDVGSNTASITMETYVWWIKQNWVTGQYIWQTIPDNIVDYGYSLHVKDNSITSTESEDPMAIKVYPNPASSQIFIDLNQLGAGNIQMELYDAVGNVVLTNEYSEDSNGRIIIPTHDLSNGMYICRLRANSEIYTSKIIVNK